MQNNDFIRITFESKIKETGQKFDSAEDIPIVVGGGYSLKGVEEILLQMKVGEKKTVEVVPEKAFGKRNAALVKLISIAEFRRHGTKPVPGMTVDADNKRGRVLSVSGGRVRVDFNHPLAGKILVYEIEVKKKIETPEDKIKSLVEIFTRRKDNVNVKIVGKEAEVELPPLLNSLLKKKIADEIIRLLELEKVKFVEVFEKPKEKKEQEQTNK
ncbi:MAG: FKBP-type peptidyl-prolyl cis-trans isomerase [Candidatus Heimdallarchaeaceae archaeon]|jgi:FKBP-type peptidyl-prolyl cis-trans isomerase 2